jgi:hypothetical protein
MNALTNLVPILIIYTTIVVYIFNYKISPSIDSQTTPVILYLIIVLFVTHGIGSSLLSLYSSYSHCKRYSIYTTITSGLRMFLWMTLVTIALFFFDGFITPFKNIFTDSDINKVNTIAYSFYLSIFAILVGILVYYDSKTDSCGPDASAIEKNVKELDDILNGKSPSTQNNT